MIDIDRRRLESRCGGVYKRHNYYRTRTGRDVVDKD